MWRNFLLETSVRVRARSIPPGRLKRGPKALMMSTVSIGTTASEETSRNLRSKVMETDDGKGDINKSIWAPVFL